MNGLRNPLKQAHNHGAAGDGVGHWWAQRFTAILLVPLTLWLVWALSVLTGADHGTASEWLGRPWNAAMAILLIGALFYHGKLGLQVVVEDYVHHRLSEMILQILITAGALLGGVLSVIAILRVALA